MMFSDAIDEPVAVVVENATALFPKLTLGDLAALGAKWAAEDQSELRKLLVECAAPADVALSKRIELAEKTQDISYVFACLGSRKRAMEVLAKSLERDGRPTKDAAEFVSRLKLANKTFLDAAMRVCGLSPQPNGAAGDPKEKDRRTGNLSFPRSQDSMPLIQPT